MKKLAPNRILKNAIKVPTLTRSFLQRQRHRFSAVALTFLAGVVFGVGASYGEDFVPPLAKLSSAKASLIIQIDVHGASGAAIWRTVRDQAQSAGLLQNALSGFDASMFGPNGAFAALKPSELAEISVVVEGQGAFTGPGQTKSDPDFGVLVGARFEPEADWRQALDQFLSGMERLQPGARAKLEKTKRRVGAADYYDLPTDGSGDGQLPFPLAMAVGSSASGGELIIGKGDAVRAFLEGRRDGQFPGWIDDLLVNRGQVWIAAAIPESALQKLSGSANGLAMLPQPMAGGLRQLRNVGLGLKFGDDLLRLELGLGFTDAAAAQQIGTFVQSLLTMSQLTGAQNAKGNSPSVQSAKIVMAGSTLRLTSGLSVDEVLQAVQSASQAAALNAKRAPRGVVKVQEVAPPEPSPVDLAFVELLPGDLESLREAKLKIENHSPKPVHQINVAFDYLGAKGEKLKNWTSEHQDPDAENLVAGNATRVFKCPVFHVPLETKSMSVRVVGVIFADGQAWPKKP